MDVLSNVLQSVRLKGAVFFDVHACEPIVAQTPHMSLVGQRLMPHVEHVIPFHVILRGSCWVETVDGDEPPARIQEGDIVIYPHGHGHIFVSTLGARLPPDLSNFRRRDGQPLPIMMNLGEGPRTMRFVCGYLGCDAHPFNPLLEALPPQVLAKRPPEGNLIEVDLIQAAVEESEAHRAGGETVLARLSELLFIRVLRRYIERAPANSQGWLAGLADPHVGRALHLIHEQPGRDWTLEELSRGCGLSRAALAERFAECVGETPMRYLTKWRMQVAARLLEQPGRSLDSVAEEVGYRSESAFNRAFKNVVGEPPGSWRRRGLSSAATSTLAAT
jgi:AraC-like DNA-binding protein